MLNDCSRIIRRRRAIRLLPLCIFFFFFFLPNTQLLVSLAQVAETPLDRLDPIMKCRKIIIVRHAEKDESYGEVNAAPLTSNGLQMARKLASTLADEPVTKIFVSPALRTQQTAEPVQKMLSEHKRSFNTYTNLSSHETRQVQEDIDVVSSKVQPGDDVLIISHSSRIPSLLSALNASADGNIDYGKMWIIIPRGVSFDTKVAWFLPTNASYIGPYLGADNQLKTEELESDISHAQNFKENKYSRGFVTVFGAARIDTNAPENRALYNMIMEFAELWTHNHRDCPIMTGGGPGLMTAANLGAMKAGGPSIAYATYYGSAKSNKDPRTVFQKCDSKEIVTDGVIFSSDAIRESMMILHSAAIVIAPGGVGTAWETFQAFDMAKYNQLTNVPIVLVGNKNTFWTNFYNHLDQMTTRDMLKREDVNKCLTHIEGYSASNLLDMVEKLYRQARELATQRP
jgi:predicted Rossmann-fold nucleotide-binding protein/phosphohistidine phosphatase SixA